jgi:hypothetical protein
MSCTSSGVAERMDGNFSVAILRLCRDCAVLGGEGKGRLCGWEERERVSLWRWF